MRVTVLGSAASYPGPGRACSGHHLEAAGASVLFDCGNGVVANLAQITDPTTLDAVFITHDHPDHFADLYALHAALRFAPDGPRPPMPLFAPAGLWERIPAILTASGAADIAEAFVPVVLRPHVAVVLGDLSVTPVAVEHTDPTFALVARAEGAKLAYTSDTARCAGAAEAAHGADLLLAEATLAERFAGLAAHMTARQAGGLAREACARKLVLVHVWPTNDRDAMAREASEEFGAPVVVADEFSAFEVIATGKDD